MGDPAAALSRTLDRCDPPPHLWVGFSGGVDSTVLLHLARQAAAERSLPIGAVHVNHGLQSAASRWVQHCQAVCDELTIPLTVLGPGAGNRNSETAARTYRYRVLADWLGPDHVLLLAHHRDDQAETLLLNLLRGSGLDGLAAMPERRAFGAGWLVRPLLPVSRSALIDVARSAGLAWIEDPANAETERPRNALRHEILPALRRRWPAADRTLARAAGHLAEARTALATTLDLELARLLGADGATLDLPGWRALPDSHRPLLIRRWLEGLGLPPPNQRQLDELLRQLSVASADRHPVMAWPGTVVRRFRERLYASPPETDLPPDTALAFDDLEVVLPGGLGRLYWRRLGASGHRPPPLTVRFRVGGERIRLPGRHHHHALKDLFNRAAIPPWERGRIPLLYEGQELLAVADLWPGYRWSRLETQCGHRLCWERG